MLATIAGEKETRALVDFAPHVVGVKPVQTLATGSDSKYLSFVDSRVVLLRSM